MRLEDVEGELNRVRMYADSLEEGRFLMQFHMIMAEKFKTDRYGWSLVPGSELRATGRAMGPKNAYIEFEYVDRSNERN